MPDVWIPKLDQEIPHEGRFLEGGLDGAVDLGIKHDTTGSRVQTAPLFLDFESNPGKLVGTLDWEWGKLNFQAGTNCDGTYHPPKSGKSGTRVWGTVLNDCYNPRGNAENSCTNASTTDDSVLTLKVKIPTNFTRARLTYWEWQDYFLTFDWSEVRVNGKVVKQTCTGSSPSPVQWTHKTILLNAYIGQTISISFHFMATLMVNQSGWYIDDISVKEL